MITPFILARAGISSQVVLKSSFPSFTPTFQVEPGTDKLTAEPSDSIYHQWPYRGLAFASDLGTLGYLLQKPRLGMLGWAIALPYYAAALFSRPTAAEKQDEALYQVSANGVFPFLAAKAGTCIGHWLATLVAKQLPLPKTCSLNSRIKLCEALIGLFGLLAFTPRLGDPLSAWLVQQNRIRRAS
jgi:hypothetical protein